MLGRMTLMLRLYGAVGLSSEKYSSTTEALSRLYFLSPVSVDRLKRGLLTWGRYLSKSS